MNSDEQAFVHALDHKLMDAMLTVDSRPLDKPNNVAEMADINWLKGELNDAHMFNRSRSQGCVARDATVLLTATMPLLLSSQSPRSTPG